MTRRKMAGPGLALLAALSLATPLAAVAQDTALAPGSLVRAAVPATGRAPAMRYTGYLRSLRADSLIMETTPGRVDTIMLGPGVRFERWSGSRRSEGLFLPGMLLGALFGRVAVDSDERGLGTMLGALGGAFVGYVAGSHVGTDVWTPVSGGGLRIGLVPVKRGVGFGVQLGNNPFH